MTQKEQPQQPPAPELETGELDVITEAPFDDSMDGQPDGDRQLTTDSDAIDEGNTNGSDLGADVSGDIGPKHE